MSRGAAVIKFKDGTTKRVSWSRGNAVRQMRLGHVPPGSAEQREFLESVEEVVIDQSMLVPVDDTNFTFQGVSDKEVTEILNKPSMTGREKARAIARRIRARRASKREGRLWPNKA